MNTQTNKIDIKTIRDGVRSYYKLNKYIRDRYKPIDKINFYCATKFDNQDIYNDFLYNLKDIVMNILITYNNKTEHELIYNGIPVKILNSIYGVMLIFQYRYNNITYNITVFSTTNSILKLVNPNIANNIFMLPNTDIQVNIFEDRNFIEQLNI